MLIVLEGLDGAGKSTQVELVRRMFAQEGVESHFLHFPRFDAPVYGELIARFLRGELGAVDKVDPYLVALLFAGDRADAAAQLRCWLDAGHAVVLDRPVLAYYLKNQERAAKVLTIPAYIADAESFGFAVKKGNTQLLEKLNKAYADLKASGEVDKIYSKWFQE